uniref:CCDC92 domain-containing protein n=1 Tax=Macrostomum lignano TaxID=282301 RepID=A0A1I8GLX8_9PLAT
FQPKSGSPLHRMEDPFSSRTAGLHLPQWSRVAHLETFSLQAPNSRIGAPKTPVLPPIDSSHQAQAPDGEADVDEGAGDLASRRAVYLEKNLNFLRIQHEEMLASLQAEIERLRLENKAELPRLRLKCPPLQGGWRVHLCVTTPADVSKDAGDSADADAAVSAAVQLDSSEGGHLREQLQLVQKQLADEKRQRQALQLLLEQQTEQLQKEK